MSVDDFIIISGNCFLRLSHSSFFGTLLSKICFWKYSVVTFFSASAQGTLTNFLESGSKFFLGRGTDLILLEILFSYELFHHFQFFYLHLDFEVACDPDAWLRCF